MPTREDAATALSSATNALTPERTALMPAFELFVIDPDASSTRTTSTPHESTVAAAVGDALGAAIGTATTNVSARRAADTAVTICRASPRASTLDPGICLPIPFSAGFTPHVLAIKPMIASVFVPPGSPSRRNDSALPMEPRRPFDHMGRRPDRDHLRHRIATLRGRQWSIRGRRGS